MPKEQDKTDGKRPGSFLETVLEILNSFTGVVDYVVKEANEELEKIKKKLMRFFVTLALLGLAMFLIIVGALMFIAETANVSTGLVFMIAGCVVIVVMSVVYLIRNLGK